MHSYAVKLILALLIAVNINVAIADDNAKHKLKLDTIAQLLNSSSVSRHILNSGNDVSIQYYNLSKAAYKSAVSEFNKGNIKTSNLYIKKTTDTLSDATLFANINKKDVNMDTNRHLYEETKKSVDALMLAVYRVAKEKGGNKSNQKTIDKINKLNDHAHELASQKSYTKASKELEKTLAMIRKNISHLKMGDTLVRTLSFANLKEEYIYEIDRSDAHFILLKMFLSDKKSINKDFITTKKQANKLRLKAEKLAKNKNYKAAIQVLEKSTQIIIKTIRQSGNNIPS